MRQGIETYEVPHELNQDSRMSEDLPFGSRGGTAIRHDFPADGEYKLSGRLVRGVEEGYAGVEGNDLPHTFARNSQQSIRHNLRTRSESIAASRLDDWPDRKVSRNFGRYRARKHCCRDIA